MELFRRHIASSPFCANCGVAEETTFHVFMKCKGVGDIWRLAPFHLLMPVCHVQMWLILRAMKGQFSEELFLVAVVICWKIWEVQNSELHGLEEGFPSDLVLWAQEFISLYQETQGSGLSVLSPASPQTWSPPALGIIKLNVDVVFPVDASFF